MISLKGCWWLSVRSQFTFLAYIYSLLLLSPLVIDISYTFSKAIKTPLSCLFLPPGFVVGLLITI